MKKIVFCLSLLMFVISVVRAAETDELVRIRQNYVRSLLPSGGEQEDLVRYLQQITPLYVGDGEPGSKAEGAGIAESAGEEVGRV